MSDFSRWPFALAISLVAGVSHADEISLFKAPTDLSIKESTPPRHGLPVPYASSGPGATWSVVAWSIPGGNLPDFSRTTSDGGTIFSSRAAEASVSIDQPKSGAVTIRLAQDGKVLPCLLAGNKPRESDLLLHPNNADNRFESDAYLAERALYSLTQLGGLTVKADVSYDSGIADRTDLCGVSQGGALIGVILVNRVAHQTFFYQLDLAVVCGPQPPARQAYCEKVLANPASNFFSSKNPFGVDDRLPLLGKPFLIKGQATHLEVDVLPRLSQFVAEGPGNMDRDPSHWRVNAFYAGQSIWGGLTLSTNWSGLELVADVR